MNSSMLNKYVGLLVVILLSCAERQEQHNHAHEEKYTCSMHPQIIQDKPGKCPICHMDLVPIKTSGTDPMEIMLSDAQIKLGNIKTASTQSGLSGNVILTGKLTISELQKESVTSRVAGRIERLFIKEAGAKIKKGNPLYEIYSEDLLTLQNEYLLNLEQYEQMKEERYKSFVRASGKKLLLFGMTEGQVVMLKQKKEPSARITFLAPASGVVTEIFASEGTYVAEGGKLYTVANLDKLWVEAELYENEVALFAEDQLAEVKIAGFENNPEKGRVTFLSPRFEQSSSVLILRAEVDNKSGRYFPGMQANLVLPTQTSSHIKLPVDAIIRDEKGDHVWVETARNTFRPKSVTLGIENGEFIEILNGIDPADKIVVSGAYLLYSELKLKGGGS